MVPENFLAALKIEAGILIMALAMTMTSSVFFP
jgi:hypothetical protein